MRPRILWREAVSRPATESSTGTRQRQPDVLHGLTAVAALKAQALPQEEGQRQGSPRPRRRGRIEGCRSPRGCPGTSAVLHGLTAVAALKGQIVRMYGYEPCVLHGLTAVAALKVPVELRG